MHEHARALRVGRARPIVAHVTLRPRLAVRAVQVLIACFALVVATAPSDASDAREAVALLVARAAGAPPRAQECSVSPRAARAFSGVAERSRSLDATSRELARSLGLKSIVTKDASSAIAHCSAESPADHGSRHELGGSFSGRVMRRLTR